MYYVLVAYVQCTTTMYNVLVGSEGKKQWRGRGEFDFLHSLSPFLTKLVSLSAFYLFSIFFSLFCFFLLVFFFLRLPTFQQFLTFLTKLVSLSAFLFFCVFCVFFFLRLPTFRQFLIFLTKLVSLSAFFLFSIFSVFFLGGFLFAFTTILKTFDLPLQKCFLVCFFIYSLFSIFCSVFVFFLYFLSPFIYFAFCPLFCFSICVTEFGKCLQTMKQQNSLNLKSFRNRKPKKNL